MSWIILVIAGLFEIRARCGGIQFYQDVTLANSKRPPTSPSLSF